MLVGSSLKFGPSALATNHDVKPTDSAHSIDDPTCLSTPHCHIHLTDMHTYLGTHLFAVGFLRGAHFSWRAAQRRRGSPVAWEGWAHVTWGGEGGRGAIPSHPHSPTPTANKMPIQTISFLVNLTPCLVDPLPC